MRLSSGRRVTLVAAVVFTLAALVPTAVGATPSDEGVADSPGFVPEAETYTVDLVPEVETYPLDFVAQEVVMYPLTFPVLAPTYFSDTFGACRDGCTRTHEGIDIMGYGWKGLPIVAAHAGTITITTESAGRDCCSIWGLTADDGWKTVYIHMNNDTPGTDDGDGWGFAPGIVVGAQVEAGQLIGWVGDSGNAESISPHLHFELRRPDGTPVNPYESLLAADRTVVPRIEGQSRFDTAVEISKSAFPDGSGTVFIGTGLDFPDALAGGPAAATVGAPVLLSMEGYVPQVTLDEIDRLGARRIVMLGGETALSADVFETLKGHADDVMRFWGENRFATAAAISLQFFDPDTSVVYIANGLTFPDAVSGAPAAARDGAPLLLTLPDRIPDETVRELERIGPATIVVLGGTSMISDAVETELQSYASSVVRLAGSTRYGTAAAIAAHAWPDGASKVYVATGDGFADALAGIAISHSDDAPLVLVGDTVPPETAAAIEGLGATSVVILGGVNAVPATVDMELWNVVNHNDMPVWK